MDLNGVWFTDFKEDGSGYDENKFFEAWEKLATLFAENPFVVGYDLRNEVRPVIYGTRGNKVIIPYWGKERHAMLMKAEPLINLSGFVSLHLVDWQAAAQK